MAEPARRYFPVHWDQLHRDAKALSWRLAGLGPWRGIIAVTRGGLVPAHIIARELDVRIIDTIGISSYDHQDQREPEIVKPSVAAGDGSGWLVIDDLVDTGQTGKIVRQLLPKAHFATIYAKPLGRPLVDTFITEVSQDTWILFPWDSEPTYAPPASERLRNGGRGD
ncbi:xanthine phosphoribosyltransferase [Geminicoccus flavidas]|uniref:xanthine phosphoribosyltransferase n=1 Tax=Geminicoccus flavidas TaxID=2506407 RepID=UPI001358CE35|nr:xanthine phosphoribosyltransferase [Geminicoccus flavidas]